MWCLVHGSDLLSAALASVKQSKSNVHHHHHHHQQQHHHHHHHRHVHNHPSFLDSVTLLTLALRLASNDILSILRNTSHHQSAYQSTFSFQKPSDPSSSDSSMHTRQLPIWPNSSGGSLRAKMRSWALDSLALAAYSLNDYAYRFELEI